MLISTAGKIYTAHQENFSDVAEHGLICQPPITVVNMKSFLDHIRSSDTFVELVEYSLATNHAAKETEICPGLTLPWDSGERRLNIARRG